MLISLQENKSINNSFLNPLSFKDSLFIELILLLLLLFISFILIILSFISFLLLSSTSILLLFLTLSSPPSLTLYKKIINNFIL